MLLQRAQFREAGIVAIQRDYLLAHHRCSRIGLGEVSSSQIQVTRGRRTTGRLSFFLLWFVTNLLCCLFKLRLLFPFELTYCGFLGPLELSVLLLFVIVGLFALLRGSLFFVVAEMLTLGRNLVVTGRLDVLLAECSDSHGVANMAEQCRG